MSEREESRSGRESVESAAEQAGESPEFAEAWNDIREEVALYRRRHVEIGGPDAAFATRMRRDLERLVLEDVERRFREESSVARLGRRLRELGASWRDLLGSSVAFRFASRGALALGVGLVLAFVYDLALDRSSLRADEIERSRDLAPAAVSLPLPPEDEGEAMGERAVRGLRDSLPREGLDQALPGGRRGR